MIGEHPNQTPSQAVDATERKWQALEMRKRGCSYRQIAKKLECSLSTAHGYISEALVELRGKVIEAAEELREVEVQKLDRIERMLNQKLRDANAQDTAKLSAVILKTQESRRKLLGLDAAQKIEMSGNLYSVKETSPDCDEWTKPRSVAALPDGKAP